MSWTVTLCDLPGLVYQLPKPKLPHLHKQSGRVIVVSDFKHIVLYVGDFNSYHSRWKYSSDNNNGMRLCT